MKTQRELEITVSFVWHKSLWYRTASKKEHVLLPRSKIDQTTYLSNDKKGIRVLSNSNKTDTSSRMNKSTSHA